MKPVNLEESSAHFIKRQKNICREFRIAVENLDCVKPKVKMIDIEEEDESDFEDYIDNRSAASIVTEEIKQIQRELRSIQNLMKIGCPESTDRKKRVEKKLSKLNSILIDLLKRAESTKDCGL